MAERYQVGWYRFIPFLGYHQVLMLINIIAIVFWCFILSSCTSTNGLKEVYLLSLSYKSPAANAPSDPLLLNPNATQWFAEEVVASSGKLQEIRIGYISTCISPNSGVWFCTSDEQDIATFLRSDLDGDPLNLARLAHTIRTGVVFYALIIIAIIFTLLATLLLGTFPNWHEEEDSEGSERQVKPFPSRPVSQLTLALLFVATALGFASAFWQHIGAAGASTLTRLLTYDMVEARIGAASMVFAWIATGAMCVATIGMLVMILSIQVLAQLGE